MNTGVKEVIYIDVYNGFEETAEMLTSSGISIHKYEVI
jgi:deoxycytidylate deaminase